MDLVSGDEERLVNWKQLHALSLKKDALRKSSRVHKGNELGVLDEYTDFRFGVRF